MKENKKLFEVEKIQVHDTLGLYYQCTSGDLYSFDKTNRIAQNIYDFRFINSGIVYTERELGDLFVVMNDGSEKVLSGFFYLAFFIRLPKYYALVKNDSPNDLTNKVVLVDQLFETQKPFKPFRATIDGYFATGKRNQIIVFDENLNELWKRELIEMDDSLSDDLRLPRTFFTTSEALIIPLESGQLLAIDILTGELIWKRERVGRTALFDNKIYCIADYIIRVLDSKTGEILQEESMQDLIDTYGFRPTGAHKVYDKYIFAMASGKPGMVAIYDRQTLEFHEMLKLDEMIPMGTDHLHWHNGRLYVLDFGKTLHVFEQTA
ncbi:hypothetical protein [Marinoscillum sp.]|uniref:hypothetical protein n=1 Tax=Marinoscillum sp. TaxID=2024838 RepID=UPI003BA96666